MAKISNKEIFDNKKSSIKKTEVTVDEETTESTTESTINNVDNVSDVIPMRELYINFISDGLPYRIYYKGTLIYDSLKFIQKPIFEADGFYLFNRLYIYRGVRFEKIN